MPRVHLFPLAALVLAGAVAFAQEPPPAGDAKPATPPADEKTKIDGPVRDFKLKDVMKDEESFVTLSELKGKTVVLFFVSDKCSVTWKYEKRTGQLISDFKKKGVVFLGIRSSANDSAQDIRKYAEAKNFDIPVLYDDKNVIADYFGATSTPQYAVIDDKGVLRYYGACDDLQNPAGFSKPEDSAKKQYVREALEAVLAGKEVAVKEAKGYG